jgi:hypothetical protein
MAQPGASHALVFRIMRLARPSLAQEEALRFDMDHDLIADASAAALPQLGSALPASYPFAGRVHLVEPGQAGLSGLLCLPQAFGLVYLGEMFQAYVTVCNYSDQAVTNVAVKVRARGDFLSWGEQVLLQLGAWCVSFCGLSELRLG